MIRVFFHSASRMRDLWQGPMTTDMYFCVVSFKISDDMSILSPSHWEYFQFIT